jgi:hypothetical protein
MSIAVPQLDTIDFEALLEEARGGFRAMRPSGPITTCMIRESRCWSC